MCSVFWDAGGSLLLVVIFDTQAAKQTCEIAEEWQRTALQYSVLDIWVKEHGRYIMDLVHKMLMRLTNNWYCYLFISC